MLSISFHKIWRHLALYECQTKPNVFPKNEKLKKDSFVRQMFSQNLGYRTIYVINNKVILVMV